MLAQQLLHVLCCAVLWHVHVHKMLVMRAAWSGFQLHTRDELLRGAMSAFKANWREELLHRKLLAAAFVAWRQLMDRNKAVASVRKRATNVSNPATQRAAATACCLLLTGFEQPPAAMRHMRKAAVVVISASRVLVTLPLHTSDVDRSMRQGAKWLAWQPSSTSARCHSS